MSVPLVCLASALSRQSELASPLFRLASALFRHPEEASRTIRASIDITHNGRDTVAKVARSFNPGEIVTLQVPLKKIGDSVRVRVHGEEFHYVTPKDAVEVLRSIHFPMLIACVEDGKKVPPSLNLGPSLF